MKDYNQHLKKHVGHKLQIMDWAGGSVVIYCRDCYVPVVDECRGRCTEAKFLEQAIERKFIELSNLIDKVLRKKLES